MIINYNNSIVEILRKAFLMEGMNLDRVLGFEPQLKIAESKNGTLQIVQTTLLKAVVIDGSMLGDAEVDINLTSIVDVLTDENIRKKLVDPFRR